MAGAHIFFNNKNIVGDDINIKYMQIEDCEFDDYKHVASFSKSGHPNEVLHYCQNHKTKPNEIWNPKYPFIRSMKTGDIIFYYGLAMNGQINYLTYLLLRETFVDITQYDDPFKLQSKLDHKLINHIIDKPFIKLKCIDGSEISYNRTIDTSSSFEELVVNI
jgi:hypothetical protein